VQGWTNGAINFDGKYFQYEDVHTEYSPKQKPYPPLWYPTSNRSSIEWVGKNGIRTAFSMHLAPSMQAVHEMVDMYWEAYDEHKNDPGRLNEHADDVALCGISGHVHVADTDEQALREAREGYQLFHHNFLALRMKPGDLQRYDGLNFDKLHEGGRFFCGSPETVRQQLKNCFDSTGANYFMANFTFGSMTEQQLTHSIDLFAKQVMPAFQKQAVA
ncbi:MAG TPA: LLM class flavin-dependent oxidoreductase, partial [Chloroflexota bacterium]|nr:LLM class flavin-dependent oxidoreductase [Chloroflexota bacterium]